MTFRPSLTAAAVAAVSACVVVVTGQPATAETVPVAPLAAAQPLRAVLTDATGLHAVVTFRVTCPLGATGQLHVSLGTAASGGPLRRSVPFVTCTGVAQKVAVTVDVPSYDPTSPAPGLLRGTTYAATLAMPMFTVGEAGPTSGEYRGTFSAAGSLRIR